MNNKGWIKLHRDLLDSSVNSRPHLAWLFTVLLLNATHEDTEFIFNGEKQTLKKGQLITGIFKLGQQALLTIQQVRSGLTALKSTNRITIKTTNKYSLITICNWDQYQSDNKQNNKPVTNQQQTNNKPATTYNKYKEVKNTNNTISRTPVQYGNTEVTFILDEFTKQTGTIPLESTSRRIAYNIAQVTNTFIKKFGSVYEEKRNTPLTFNGLIIKAWEVYKKNNGDHLPQRLTTFKEHYKVMLYQLQQTLI